MVDTFNVQAIYVAIQAVPSMHVSEHTIEASFSLATAGGTVTIHEGCVPSRDPPRGLGRARRHGTPHQTLTEREYFFTTTAEREIVGDGKHRLGDIAASIDSETKDANDSSDNETNYNLTDGITSLSAVSSYVAPMCVPIQLQWKRGQRHP